MSFSSSPAFPRAARDAGAGPMPINSGSQPTTAEATRRPSGFLPFARAFSAEVTTTAAAASTIPEAFPAVTCPPSPKDGGSAASASSVVSGRRWSSFSTRTVLRPDFTSTGTISSESRQEAQAAPARF